MKDREIQCMYYTYEGGPCNKCGAACRFRGRMQVCKKYRAKPNGTPARKDERGKILHKIFKKENKNKRIDE